MAKTNGTILYDGPSRLGGHVACVATCIERATNNSKMSIYNRGVRNGMVQIYFIPTDPGPASRVRSDGRDTSVCGDCPLKPSLGGVKLRSERTLDGEIICPASDEGGHRVGCQECGLCAGASRQAKDILIQLHGAVRSQCYVRVEESVRSVIDAYHRGSYSVGEWSRLQGRDMRTGAWGDPYSVPDWVTLRLWAIAGGACTGYTHQWRRPDAQPLRLALMASVETAAARDVARSMGWRTFRTTA